MSVLLSPIRERGGAERTTGPPRASGKVAKKVEKLAKTNPKGDKKAPSPSARNHM
jgi:hypothetical protein